MAEQALHYTTGIAGPSSANSRATQTQAQTQTHIPPPGSTPIYRTLSRTVRRNWIYYLRASWDRISRTSKVILGTTLLIGLAQIIITITMLIIGKNEICDKPLDIYLLVFLVRLGFSLPLMLYQYLRPSGLSGRSDQTISTTTSQEAVTTSSLSIASSPNTTPTSQDRGTISALPSPATSSTPDALEDTLSTNNTTSISNTPTSSPDQLNNTQQHSPYRPTIMRSSWLDRFKSLLDLISILWFVVGNYMIFTASEQCHLDAKYLFYTTMTWILLGYFLVLIPLLICVAVVFCLPCLLVAMRVMNVDYATGMVGANKNEIQSIPVYKYKASLGDHQGQESYHRSPSVSSSSYLQGRPSPPPSLSVAEKKKNGIMSHFSSYHNKYHNHHDDDDDDDDEESGLEEWTTDPIDASCTICLSDYESGDLVCRLRCNHHFHKYCVHEWLSLNYKCPLCQRDFRMDKADGDDYEDETDIGV